jgi:lipopolysaccharide transport system ATP-binding protein
MNDVARSGRTVVLVSHNMGAISELCTHGVLLEKGTVAMTGPIKPVVDGYAKMLTEDSAGVELADTGGLFAITGVSLENSAGEQARTFDTEEEMVLTITYRLRSRMNGVLLAAQLSRNFTDIVYSYDTDDLDEVPVREAGLYQSRMRIPAHFLKGGHYSVRVAAGAPNQLLADHPGVLQFDIEELSQNFNERAYRADRPGHIIFPGKWTIDRVE